MATQLFLDDVEPFSVHCLAASALDHAELLGKENGVESFQDHILGTFPDMSVKDLKKLRNKYWTPIKHPKDQKGNLFDLSDRFSDFDDTKNDPVLFAGWYDFMKSGQPIPLEAQVFQAWFFKLYPHTIDPEKDFSFAPFERIAKYPRFHQKALLKEQITRISTDKSISEHAKTDTRPLMLNLYGFNQVTG